MDNKSSCVTKKGYHGLITSEWQIPNTSSGRIPDTLSKTVTPLGRQGAHNVCHLVTAGSEDCAIHE